MPTRDIVVIAASEGGVVAVADLLRSLPAALGAALFVVVHTRPDGPGLLPGILSRATALSVTAAEDGQPIAPGRVYVAPPDRHLVLEDGFVRLSNGPKERHTRPAADPLFRSAAHHYGPRVVGIILTGGDGDGTAGARAIKARGGVVIVQEPHEARNPAMPREALLRDHPDFRLPLAEIPSVLVRLSEMPVGAFPV
jgi:two-component system chemotaxis response regulator CheB